LRGKRTIDFQIIKEVIFSFTNDNNNNNKSNYESNAYSFIGNGVDEIVNFKGNNKNSSKNEDVIYYFETGKFVQSTSNNSNPEQYLLIDENKDIKNSDNILSNIDLIDFESEYDSDDISNNSDEIISQDNNIDSNYQNNKVDEEISNNTISENNDIQKTDKDNNDGDFDNMSEISYDSEIHIACLNNNIEIIDMLISCEYDINERCGDGSTPLFLSIKKNKYESVKYLIEHQADLTIPDNYWNTPKSFLLKHLSEENYSKLIELLIPYIYSKNNIDELYSEGNSLLLSVIKSIPTNLKVIETIISNGANPNQIDSEEKVPLIYAIEQKNIDLIRLLIKYKADISFKTPNEKSPVAFACKINDKIIVKELLKGKKNNKWINE